MGKNTIERIPEKARPIARILRGKTIEEKLTVDDARLILQAINVMRLQSG
jgi:hypothetical protein